MKKNPIPPADAAELRRRGEERLKEKKRGRQGAGEEVQRSAEETQRLVQELQVHQIEMEMQNEELRQSRAEVETLLGQYKDLYDFAPVGYVTLDRIGTIRRVNLTGTALLGEERARLVNRRFGLFVSPADRPAFNDFLQKVFTNQTAASDKAACEVTLCNKQDRPPAPELSGSRSCDEASRRHVHIEARATEDGQECRAVMSDITDRKRAEEVLQEALEKYRSLAAYVDSMYLVDRDCTYLFMNAGHLERFGLSLEEVIGKRHSEFHSAEDSRQFAEDVGEICKTGQPSTKEHRSERDGKFYLRTFTPSIGRSSDGKISQVAIISKDITNIKLAEKKLQDTLDSLRKAVNTTIQVMVSAVETRDPYTAGHQLRSADLARAIATEMGLPQDKIDAIRMAGSIHDIGKLSIPAEILSKPTKLSELEFSLIKEHARRGFEMLKDVESPWPLAEIVYQHHERMDGSGYPRNLQGEEILMEARILNVADVVEAMSSHRPYRPGLGIDAALEEIEKNSGTLYDKIVVDACLRLFREKGYKFEGA